MFRRLLRISSWLGGLVIATFLMGLLSTFSASFGARAEGERLARMERSSRFVGGRFHNLRNQLPRRPRPPAEPRSLWDFFRTRQGQLPESPPPRAESAFTQPASDELRIHWLGHSTMLIEIDGRRVLTDPMWSRRASPYRFMGPARFQQPPVTLDDLPPLDAVLISHDHYDHLDYDTIQALRQQVEHFVVPLGVGAHLERWGVEPRRIHELDWWEEVEVGGLRLVSTPSHHFSGRGLNDRNHTAWSSWAVIGPEHRVWFSGDTGPTHLFSEIGERLGPFDATMIEIGAWDPAWAEIHLGPDEATRVHQQVRGEVMIPVHWGTFKLALHDWDGPIIELQELARARGIPLGVPLVGGSIDPAHPTVDPFWRSRSTPELSALPSPAQAGSWY